MLSPAAAVVDLAKIDREDSFRVGEEAAELGELNSNGIPIVPGFVVTSSAFKQFLQHNMLDRKIGSLLGTCNFEVESSVAQVSKHIKKIILESVIPEKLANEIFSAYEKLHAPAVSIKYSSVLLPFECKFNYVPGEASVAEKIREIWADLFSSKSMLLRHKEGISQMKADGSIIIQKIIDPDASGSILTHNPDKSKIVIKAIFGLTQSEKTTGPDVYEVDLKTYQITQKKISEQKVMLSKLNGEQREVKVSTFKKSSQKLSDKDIITMAKFAAKIKNHYYFPKDILFMKDKKSIYITLIKEQSTPEDKNVDFGNIAISSPPLLRGVPIASGIGVGFIRKIVFPKDVSKVKQGDIIIFKKFHSEFLEAVKRASGIISEENLNPKVVMAVRARGIPAVICNRGVFSALKENEAVTVNGKTGEIIKGGFLKTSLHKENLHSQLKTVTKVYANICSTKDASEILSKNTDGIGNLCGNYILKKIAVHPKKMIQDGKRNEFVNKIEKEISFYCNALNPKPVVYSLSNLTTTEYSKLLGGAAYETPEQNPGLGFRGAMRAIHDASMKSELEAVKRVLEKGFDNLQLMLPFVRTLNEMDQMKKIVDSMGLKRSKTFKLFMAVSTPSNSILIDRFLELGIDGVAVDLKTLSMLTLCMDPFNCDMEQYIDLGDESIKIALLRVVSACRKNNIPLSIYSELDSLSPFFVENMVRLGVDNISVDPESIDHIRRIVYATEEEIIRKGGNYYAKN